MIHVPGIIVKYIKWFKSNMLQNLKRAENMAPPPQKDNVSVGGGSGGGGVSGLIL